ncbi:MAG: GNAT family N-acetyltransferase [Armatimonas sp.]
MIVLETERLILRRFEPADLEPLYVLYRDPEMRQFYPEGVLTLEETRAELEWFLHGHPKHPELGLWATVLKSTGEFIGRCGLLPWELEGQHEVEVAYMIAKTHWGQGLGTEAACGVLEHGFTTLNLPRLICLIDDDNVASKHVAEKIGMQFERAGKDELGPYLLYSRNQT